MSIEIVNPGIFSTLVGGERIGFRSVGVGSGGAMDSFAMKVANYLVGNSKQATVIEIYIPSGEMLFQQSHLISITGKGFDVFLNGKLAPTWMPILVSKNSIVKLDVKNNGRAYLAIKGGWKAEEWLGSFSTHAGVQAGGHFGRRLKKGDVVEANQIYKATKSKVFTWGIASNELEKVYSPPNEIRCVTSIETNLLSKESRTVFTSSEFAITPNSNRMGFGLSGNSLALSKHTELVSSPVDFGTIQLLPDGNLIILMADHQTTGGYPRIASVIKADHPKLAQLNPNEKIRFTFIDNAEAEDLFVASHTLLEDIRKSCLLQLRKSSEIATGL